MLNRYARRNPSFDTTTQDETANANPRASEDNWMNPQNPDKLTMSDYMAMMAGMYGQTAQVLSTLQNLVELAGDRSAMALITFPGNFGADLPIPEGDMRSVIIPRPSLSEQATTFSTAIQITFDNNLSYQIKNPGITVVPIVSGTKTYKITAASNPSAGWALFLLFRNNPYNPVANL